MEIIKLWKELGVDRVIFEFSCGGDSMNDTTIEIIGIDGEPIECQELEDYIDEQVYKEVDFYVNSDGHYQGEFGTVEITHEDGDDCLTYVKSSQSEWTETIDSVLWVDIDKATEDFLRAKVSGFGYNGWRDNVVYKGDCLLTDHEEKLEEALYELVNKRCLEFVPDYDEDGELEEGYARYGTGEDGLVIEDGKLKIEIVHYLNIVKDEEL